MSIWEENLGNFRNNLASASPTPGGGAAAMVAASLGASLLSMALEISAKREDANHSLVDFRPRLEKITAELGALADRDMAAYGGYVKARALPKETADEKEARNAALAAAVENSARVPLAGGHFIKEALDIGKALRGTVSEGMLPDIKAGEAILRGAFRAAMATFEANLPFMYDEELKRKLETEREELIDSLPEA